MHSKRFLSQLSFNFSMTIPIYFSFEVRRSVKIFGINRCANSNNARFSKNHVSFAEFVPMCCSEVMWKPQAFIITTFITATLKVCERLSLKSGYALSVRHRGASPNILDSQLSSHMNSDLWEADDFISISQKTIPIKRYVAHGWFSSLNKI